MSFIVPEGDECHPNNCGPNSGCRSVGGVPICFCLPEFEGQPPQNPCKLPDNPCDPSPCGPNTQCAILSNGFAKCTCVSGYLESPNTIRGCVEQRSPCEPNPCGIGAQCDPHHDPVCFCPFATVGNPYRSCSEPQDHRMELCHPGPCGMNADCYVVSNQEQCFCRPSHVGDPYSGCSLMPRDACMPNPCGPRAQCIINQGNPQCICPPGLKGDPTSLTGCHDFECLVDDDCNNHQACIGYRCRDPCPGSCGINTNCRVEKHHPVCTCNHGLTGNPLTRCFAIVQPLPEHDPCMPSPCGVNTICQVMKGRAVCSCMPDFHGDPQSGCRPECTLNSDCPNDKACLERKCVNPCSLGVICGLHAKCTVQDHIAGCTCAKDFMGDPFFQCVPIRKFIFLLTYQ